MATNTYNNQRGGATATILAIIAVVIIGGLMYILVGGKLPEINSSRGTDAVATDTQTAPDDGGIDGLGIPDVSTSHQLDEFGVGISNVAVFNRDINGDGQTDRITRTHHETGNAHAYDEYKIELNRDGKLVDITPTGFRTIAGAECALQKLHFVMRPTFQVIKVSRPWNNDWTTPSMATKTTYHIDGGRLNATAPRNLDVVCDVATFVQ